MTAHGQQATYRTGCRCFACRAAHADYQRESVARRIEAAPWRVRYDPRRAEWRVQNQVTGEVDQRFEQAQDAYETREALNALEMLAGTGEGPWADRELVKEARAHLRGLRVAGVGLRTIAAEVGLNTAQVREVREWPGYLDGRRRLKRTTAEKVLAVQVIAAPGAFVDARETWRLLRELRRAGLRKNEVARALGQVGKANALQIGRERVRARTAEAVRDIHDTAYRGSARLREVCRCERWADV